MAPVTWIVAPEPFDTPDAYALRRSYYDEVASRYWRRPATEQEIDDGLAVDGVEQLAFPTGEFLVGRHEGKPASCGGVLLLDPATAELTRIYTRPGQRGTGGGKILLGTLEDAARRLGATRMVLNTRLDLVEARGLYVRQGYREIPAYTTGPYMEIWYGKGL
ncbi:MULTISPECIES: GNAT family N-acetyltransferase [unclassified Streptomyces]|uniref:GNAT family N-acetyltransferase n=1 Tax=unclassified Streptomyces TaxID=2593676 RepID=UPI002E0E42FA|nr:GNAT family N-acetyltransferase [Streptomyces sp. NBC_01197]WSS53502.1 GNAT family N-acetyltransferase [Streptomyces sp. NBC_01180]